MLHRIISRTREGHRVRGLKTVGVNEAVDEVRKEQWRELNTDGRKAIKGLRWLLAMHSSNRSKGHTRFLNRLRNSNRRIHRAWVLKDEFEHFWNYSYRGSAEKFLNTVRVPKALMQSSPQTNLPLGDPEIARKFPISLHEQVSHLLRLAMRAGY